MEPVEHKVGATDAGSGRRCGGTTTEVSVSPVQVHSVRDAVVPARTGTSRP